MPTNSLIHEKSPYLLQHAYNPVNWYAWGEEAFRKAREENKPIFLSVGYSTCHWCHVMERESFENEEIAALLNRHFVSIKVDREERPDVDRIYMLFVQATTGSGGWPMSVWLTPELKPFFGGTYFPPQPRYGHPGFAQVLERVAEAWLRDRAAIVASSGEIIEQLQSRMRVAPQPGLDAAALDSGFYAFRRTFDTRHGGFGGAPKFPRPVSLAFLLRYYARTRNSEALDMVLATLSHMARGGINDHLGGGFHRYAVDDHWFLPHFEKMLYDQAQLACAYIEGYQLTADESYAAAARATLDYVLRDMTSPEGAFYSAEDADSVIDAARPEKKGEGAYYVWTREEIGAIVGEPAAEWFSWQYGVEAGGNIRGSADEELEGKNILSLAHTESETARQSGRPLAEVHEAIEAARRKLFEARARRVRPHRDDKILTAWNGLVISAFARAAQVLGEDRYIEAARRAADFILTRLYDPRSGVLLWRYRDGEAAVAGFLDDYAFFVQALLDLYEACFDVRLLESAEQLAGAMITRFEDREAGGFFATEAGDSALVLRLKDDYDGAEPSGNSIAILDLLRLARMTGRKTYEDVAAKALGAFAGRMSAAAEAMPQMLVALECSRSKPVQIVLVGERDASLPFLREVHRRFLPNKTVLLIDSEETRKVLARGAPAIAGMRQSGGSVTAYVCENFACRLPVSSPQEFARVLDSASAASG
jgi:uncharacterized protein YyaL (SSP411 family)